MLSKEDREFLENRFRDFERKMHSRFDSLCAHFNGVDGRFDRIDARFERIEWSMERFQKRERPHGSQ